MEYVVLYTHQKTKKAKTWQDGFLKLASTGHRATLTDDKNLKLDTVLLKTGQVSTGDELESDRYLIQVEEVKTLTKEHITEQNPLPQENDQTSLARTTLIRPQRLQIRTSGLKRKNTGFKPPRQVKPKLSDAEQNTDSQITTSQSPGNRHESAYSQNEFSVNNSNSQNFSNLYGATETKTNSNVSPLQIQNMLKSIESGDSSLSPWSVVGKSKPKKKFYTPYSNSQSDSQNSDYELHSSQARSFCDQENEEIIANSEIQKDTQNKQSVEKDSILVKKRSTSQILALLDKKKSKFQVPRSNQNTSALTSSNVTVDNLEKDMCLESSNKSIAECEQLGSIVKKGTTFESKLIHSDISDGNAPHDNTIPKQFCDPLISIEKSLDIFDDRKWFVKSEESPNIRGFVNKTLAESKTDNVPLDGNSCRTTNKHKQRDLLETEELYSKDHIKITNDNHSVETVHKSEDHKCKEIDCNDEKVIKKKEIVNDYEDADETGCFDINFSPLSNASISDDECNFKYEGNVSNIETDQQNSQCVRDDIKLQAKSEESVDHLYKEAQEYVDKLQSQSQKNSAELYLQTQSIQDQHHMHTQSQGNMKELKTQSQNNLDQLHLQSQEKSEQLQQTITQDSKTHVKTHAGESVDKMDQNVNNNSSNGNNTGNKISLDEDIKSGTSALKSGKNLSDKSHINMSPTVIVCSISEKPCVKSSSECSKADGESHIKINDVKSIVSNEVHSAADYIGELDNVFNESFSCSASSDATHKPSTEKTEITGSCKYDKATDKVLCFNNNNNNDDVTEDKVTENNDITGKMVHRENFHYSDSNHKVNCKPDIIQIKPENAAQSLCDSQHRIMSGERSNEESKTIGLLGIEFTPENSGVPHKFAADSVEKLMSKVVMPERNSLIPQKDKNDTGVALPGTTDIVAGKVEELSKVDSSLEDFSCRSQAESATTIDTMATYSEESSQCSEKEIIDTVVASEEKKLQHNIPVKNNRNFKRGDSLERGDHFDQTVASNQSSLAVRNNVTKFPQSREFINDSLHDTAKLYKSSSPQCQLPKKPDLMETLITSEQNFNNPIIQRHFMQKGQHENVSRLYTGLSSELSHDSSFFGPNINTLENMEHPLNCKDSSSIKKQHNFNKGDEENAIHKTLPHPSDLKCTRTLRPEQSAGIKIEHPTKNIISKPNSKLQNYTMKGTIAGSKVLRESTHGKSVNQVSHVNVSSDFMEDVNQGFDHSLQTVMTGQDMQAPNTPELPTEEDNDSFYYFNPKEEFKKRFDNETNFLITPKRFLKQMQSQILSSPVQQVPSETHKISPVKNTANNILETRILDRRHMQPVISNPYDDHNDVDNLTANQEYHHNLPLSNSTKENNFVESCGLRTPLQSRVPIWMKDSPGDFSISESPFGRSSTVKKRNQVSVISTGLDCDSQDSEIPESVSHPLDGGNEIQNHPLRSGKPADYSCLLRPVADNRNRSARLDSNFSNEDKLRTHTDYYDGNDISRKYRDFSVPEFDLEYDKKISECSRWDKFQHKNRNDTFYNKNQVQNRIAIDSENQIFSRNNLYTCRNTGLHEYTNDISSTMLDKHGVDHLVPISPANQTLIELTSDVSTDDSQLMVNDDTLFEDQFFNDKSFPKCDGITGECYQGSKSSHLRKGFKPPRAAAGNAVSPGLSMQPTSFQVPYNKHTINSVVSTSERNLCSDLHFPSKEEADCNATPQRQITIPVTFANTAMYKQVFTAALNEYLNIQLFELSKNYHTVLSKVDVSSYTPSEANNYRTKQRAMTPNKSANPACEHGQPSKILQVKKEGPNKGRFFFVCNSQRNNQCKYFKWADETTDKNNQSRNTREQKGLSLSDAESIGTYLKGQGIALYCECFFLRKVPDSYKPYLKNIPSWAKHKQMEVDNSKKKIYIRLSRKESSTTYTKDDLWVVSQHLSFDSSCTFLARSVFFGPNASSEIEIEPMYGYSPSNWTTESMCHAIHAGNASNELMCLSNLQDFVQPTSLPILPYLLSLDNRLLNNNFSDKGKVYYGDWYLINEDARGLIAKHDLNEYQALALRRVADMFNSEVQGPLPAVSLIHGVFGAGKSFLLAVIVKFLVQIFDTKDSYATDVLEPTKVLISSTTNVAVDRILQGLLDIGFDQFVRVGSVKKIAKPILPYSMHATGSDSQELKDLQEMMKSDITPQEKMHVKKRMDQLRKGESKKQLEKVRVVGVTCAACPFQSLKGYQFSVVILDECSQITEPASLLPIARFKCEKLILVGDPKQLDPTLQRSEAGHRQGLEQTLFDRLIKMGHTATMLKTQYRCHPRISAISNALFYDNKLSDGVTEEQRLSLVDGWPTLCFYDVSNGHEVCERGSSFVNEAEASFVVYLIELMVLEGVAPANIGVITLYKAQQSRISQLLLGSGLEGAAELKAIQISTVDAFQGGERDVIILSCVRTNSTGFMDNDKRTNVALTRSRNHLLIVGNGRNLAKNRVWSHVLKHCRDVQSGFENAASFRKKMESRMSYLKNVISDELDGPKLKNPKISTVKITQEKFNQEKGDPFVTDQQQRSYPNSGREISILEPYGTNNMSGTYINESSVLQDLHNKTDFEPVNSTSKASYCTTRANAKKRSHVLSSLFEDCSDKENSDDEELPSYL